MNAGFVARLGMGVFLPPPQSLDLRIRYTRSVPEIERPDDAALCGRLRDGDEASFRILVKELHSALTRVALAFVGSQAAAEEVVQDTWVAVIAGLDQFEGRSSLRTWIGRILVNRAKTRGVREKRVVPFSALS